MKKSVNVVLKTAEGKYVLQFRDGTPGIYNPLVWNFFGGGIKEGESPSHAASRELYEELRIETDPLDFQLVGENEFENGDYIYFLKLNRAISLKETELNEGAGIGAFQKDEILKISPSKPTTWLVEQFPD